jgi:hypothetical protein
MQPSVELKISAKRATLFEWLLGIVGDLGRGYRTLCMKVDSGTNGVKKRHFIVK